MKKYKFKLRAFSHKSHEAEIEISGDVRRDGCKLRLNYRLQGYMNRITFAPKSERVLRGHELWKETCFECFIQPKQSDAYWELNLSPAGHWNLYHFDGYRQGMCEESAVAELVVDMRKGPSELSVSTELIIEALGPDELRIGLSAIVRSVEGGLSYWALAHTGDKPDFHHPESFLLRL